MTLRIVRQPFTSALAQLIPDRTRLITPLRSIFERAIPPEVAKATLQGRIVAPPVPSPSESDRLVSDLARATQEAKPEFPIPEEIQCAIPTQPEISWFKVLETAVTTENLYEAEESLRNGADPNGSVEAHDYCVRTESGDTRTISLDKTSILHIACGCGNVPIVRSLLTWGAKLNDRDSKWGLTPLDIACFSGKTEVVKELINFGAEIDVRSDECGLTPLQSAISFSRFECCKLLVQAGAKVNEVNPWFDSTPLKTSCYRGSYKIVELLLNSGAKPNLCSSSGITPLYAAARFPAILQLMLDRGAEVNAQNGPGEHPQAGKYPIHAAACYGCVESVRTLLKAGADPTVLDSEGNTPIELAHRQLRDLQNASYESHEVDEVTVLTIQQLKEVINLLAYPTECALLGKQLEHLFGLKRT